MPAPRPKSAASKKDKKRNKADDLLIENENLKQEIEKVNAEKKFLEEKLRIICCKIFSISNKELFMLEDDEHILDVSADDYVLMLCKIVDKRERDLKGTLEQRVEELETRVTHQNMEIAALLKAKLAYEQGIQDIAMCGNIYAVRQKSRSLLTDLQSGVPDLPNIEYPRQLLPNCDRFSEDCSGQRAGHQSPDLADSSIFCRSPVAPALKSPGDTHISRMHSGLRRYVCRQLDTCRVSGPDWRRLAERVGIRDEMIQYWTSLQLKSPTERVLAEWERSRAATVRMLHRHLASMRTAVLTKLVADFYLVDN